MAPPASSTAKVVTAIRYRDVERAAEWLQAAFGFGFRACILDDGGRAAMVQLTYGDHLILVLPVGGTELDTMMRQPDEVGGVATQSCYLVVADVERHHVQSKAAGAAIVRPLEPFDKGGYGYTCRDLEGHLWSFGSYDPWSEPAVAPAPAPAVSAPKRLAAPASYAAVAGAVVLIGAGWGLWHASIQSTVAEDSLRSRLDLANEKADHALDLAARKTADLARERAAKKLIALDALRTKHQLALEREARETSESLLHQAQMAGAAERSAKIAAKEAVALANEAAARERAQREAAERAAAAARQELTLANSARSKAEHSAKEVAEQMGRERAAKEAAEQAATAARQDLALVSSARLKAERSAKEAAEQLARERAARDAAETLAKEAQDKLKMAQPPPAQAVAKTARRPARTKKAASTSDEPVQMQPMPELLP